MKEPRVLAKQKRPVKTSNGLQYQLEISRIPSPKQGQSPTPRIYRRKNQGVKPTMASREVVVSKIEAELGRKRHTRSTKKEVKAMRYRNNVDQGLEKGEEVIVTQMEKQCDDRPYSPTKPGFNESPYQKEWFFL